MSPVKRQLPAASLARPEEEHRHLSRWLASQGVRDPRSKDGWVDGLNAFAKEARLHREREEDLIRHFGTPDLHAHREEHRGIESAIDRLLTEARRFGDRGGPLMACELMASWLGHHQAAWDQVKSKRA